MNIFEAQAHLAKEHNGDDWGSMGAEDTRFTGKPELINLDRMGEQVEYRQSFDKAGKVVIVKVRIPQIKKADSITGGVADNKKPTDLAKKHKVNVLVIENAIKVGTKVEMEHTKSKELAREIALDHIWEDAKYYIKLKKVENKK